MCKKLINLSMMLVLIFLLSPSLTIEVLKNVCMSIRCTDNRSMWGIKSLYIQPRLVMKD